MEVPGAGAPSIADLDGDGVAEVVFGPTVFDAEGTILLDASSYGLGEGGRTASSVPADIDGDGLLEVVTSPTAYNLDGSLLWNQAQSDSVIAIADFDLDGSAEIFANGSSTVLLQDTNGAVLWEKATGHGCGAGAPVVADFDGDGAPEVGQASAQAFAVWNGDGSMLWSAPTQDISSCLTGASAFDFEGDGSIEILYADENDFWVFDGPTGRVKSRFTDHISGTASEYPVVADTDLDGSAEIVLPSNNYPGPGWTGITVFGSSSGSWRPARPLWNEFNYRVTNVEGDGTIPSAPVPTWWDHNTFRTASSDDGLSPLPNLLPGTPEACTLECDGGTQRIWIPVLNAGVADAPGVMLRIASASTGLSLTLEVGRVPAGDAALVGPVDLWEHTWGRGEVTVTADPDDLLEECDESDNAAALSTWPCPS